MKSVATPMDILDIGTFAYLLTGHQKAVCRILRHGLGTDSLAMARGAGNINRRRASSDRCTSGCKNPHYCGDKNIDADRGERCDLGSDVNGVYFDTDGNPSAVQTDAGGGEMKCTATCMIPIHQS